VEPPSNIDLIQYLHFWEFRKFTPILEIYPHSHPVMCDVSFISPQEDSINLRRSKQYGDDRYLAHIHRNNADIYYLRRESDSFMHKATPNYRDIQLLQELISRNVHKTALVIGRRANCEVLIGLPCRCIHVSIKIALLALQ
jgi:hypothetical protein